MICSQVSVIRSLGFSIFPVVLRCQCRTLVPKEFQNEMLKELSNLLLRVESLALKRPCVFSPRGRISQYNLMLSD